MFANPNGAGKSALIDRYVSGRLPVINPDNIARELPRLLSCGVDEHEAGARAIAERTRRLTAHETFGFKTTLSGNSELKLMRDASAAGYKVNLVYVGIPNAAASAFRVAERLRAGAITCRVSIPIDATRAR